LIPQCAYVNFIRLYIHSRLNSLKILLISLVNQMILKWKFVSEFYIQELKANGKYRRYKFAEIESSQVFTFMLQLSILLVTNTAVCIGNEWGNCCVCSKGSSISMCAQLVYVCGKIICHFGPVLRSIVLWWIFQLRIYVHRSRQNPSVNLINNLILGKLEGSSVFRF